MNSYNEWVREFFIEKGWLFLRVLEKMWERASEEALSVKKLLESLSVKENSLYLILDVVMGE